MIGSLSWACVDRVAIVDGHGRGCVVHVQRMLFVVSVRVHRLGLRRKPRGSPAKVKNHIRNM